MEIGDKVAFGSKTGVIVNIIQYPRKLVYLIKFDGVYEYGGVTHSGFIILPKNELRDYSSWIDSKISQIIG